ncbi:hypothetical protein C8R47DRAFT_1121183 [Mycena vitilis]|nr:hypothetical protein C8R47DRAFT_1121183 [Mycena vitilis]
MPLRSPTVDETRCISKTPYQSPLLLQLTKKTELHELLRSNEHPTHIQASHCVQIVSCSPAELGKYDAEILRIKTTLDEVVRERALLDEYTRMCRYTLSPIRQLPAEILNEIFTFFLPEVPIWNPSGDTPHISGLTQEAAVKEELGRVANVDLLRLSQVCHRWHQLIMGTPSLWSAIGLNFRLWDPPNRERIATVLKSSLQRGGDFPLELGVQIRGLFESGALQLFPILAQHSRRWRHVSLSVDSPTQLRGLSTVTGNLPLLKVLNLHVESSALKAGVAATSFFAVAPLLTELRYGGRVQALPNFPLEQLQYFLYYNIRPQDIDDLVSLMPRFSSICRILVEMNDDDVPVTAALPTVISPVRCLVISAAAFESSAAGEMLAKFITRLTMPSLLWLRFTYQQNQEVPLPWPHLEFLALSHRSSLCRSLGSLALESVYIAESELVQVLSGLPLLQHLGISDHRAIDGVDELVLVNNLLLQHLTSTNGLACLVPSLHHLETHTLFKFDDTIYRDFILSRLKSGRNVGGPFQVDLRWYAGYQRKLDAVVATHFMDLEAQGELLFSSAASNLFLNSDSD